MQARPRISSTPSKSRHPDFHAALSRNKPGTEAFSKTWKDLAAQDPKRFDAAQHDFIKSTHYDKQAAALRKATGLDLNTRSPVLRDVAWSTSVQHRNKIDDIFRAALRGRDPATVSDTDLIQGVHAEHGRTNPNGTLSYFQDSSLKVQRGVANRFENESRDALTSLDRLTNGGR